VPLPTGTWKVNINGQEEDFIIRSVQDGSFNGTFSGRTIDGFWDEVSQTITFGFSELRAGANAFILRIVQGIPLQNAEDSSARS
jgi:hypothetical protein